MALKFTANLIAIISLRIRRASMPGSTSPLIFLKTRSVHGFRCRICNLTLTNILPLGVRKTFTAFLRGLVGTDRNNMKQSAKSAASASIIFNFFFFCFNQSYEGCPLCVQARCPSGSIKKRRVVQYARNSRTRGLECWVVLVKGLVGEDTFLSCLTVLTVLINKHHTVHIPQVLEGVELFGHVFATHEHLSLYAVGDLQTGFRGCLPQMWFIHCFWLNIIRANGAEIGCSKEFLASPLIGSFHTLNISYIQFSRPKRQGTPTLPFCALLFVIRHHCVLLAFKFTLLV